MGNKKGLIPVSELAHCFPWYYVDRYPPEPATNKQIHYSSSTILIAPLEHTKAQIPHPLQKS